MRDRSSDDGIRVIAVGDLLRRLGLPLLRFDPDQLEAQARRRTALSDFGDPSYREGLKVVCASAEDDADLTPFGRYAFRQFVLDALCTRLLRIQALETEPATFARELNPPLIVVGLPRSGTTWLHRLLCLDPAARPLLWWELQPPIPLPGRDRRRSRVALRMRLFK